MPKLSIPCLVTIVKRKITKLNAPNHKKCLVTVWGTQKEKAPLLATLLQIWLPVLDEFRNWLYTEDAKKMHKELVIA